MLDRVTGGPERRTEVTRLPAGPVEYRWEPSRGGYGDATVIVFHGGHLRAGLALGEDVFVENGYSLLVPSRPGYGRTPVSSGRTPDGFADVTAELCERLGIDQVAAVVGISAGGRTATAMAARHPRLVQRLVLESAVGFLSWPDRRTRLGANVVFTAYAERVTWAAVRLLMRRAPDTGLRLLLGDLSTKPVDEVISGLDQADRATLVTLFSHMRSGRGFVNDLRSLRTVETEEISQPALVIGSRSDGAVPFAHAESLVADIPRAELVVSEADSHFVWFGEDYPFVAEQILRFLAVPVTDQPD